MNTRFRFAAPSVVTMLIALTTFGLGQIAWSDDGPQIPNKAEVADSLKRASVEAKRQKRPEFGANMDNALELAKQNGGIDLNIIANQYNAIAANAMVGSRDMLYVFVSLSMPKSSLIRLGKDMNKAGGTLVFRGFHKDKMSEMQKALRFLTEEGVTDIAIDPEGFKRYNVTAVPTYVLARVKENAERTASCGDTKQCDGADYVAVSGDATLGYALEYMQQHGDRAYRNTLQFYLQRLSN